jgi:hypothetical protein
MLTITHDSDLRRNLMIEKRARDILQAGSQAHTRVLAPIRLELHTDGRCWYERRGATLTATSDGETVSEVVALFAAKARSPSEAVEIRRGAMGGSNITLF